VEWKNNKMQFGKRLHRRKWILEEMHYTLEEAFLGSFRLLSVGK